MPTPPPDLETLLNEDWKALLGRLALYSGRRVKLLRWRGAGDGVLPDGYDAGSIAAQAITDLLRGSYPWHRRSAVYTQEELWRELMRLASQRVKNLWIRAENTTTDSYDEPDVTGQSNGDNQYASAELRPDQKVERQEAQARLAEFRRGLGKFLADEPLLAALVKCAFKGETRREEIARSLRVSPQQITNARKRLERRLAEYAQLHPDCPLTLIQQIIHA